LGSAPAAAAEKRTDRRALGPTASFSSSCINLECSFTNLSSGGAATIAAYRWEFGDGAVATTQDAQHTYATAIPYAVKLTVTDNAGLTGQVTHAVQVNRLSNMPPIGVPLAPPASLGR